MKRLILIPARGGSKGLPGKNIKALAGKELISYSIDVARKFSKDELICVSTDDAEIIKVVEKKGLKVPFVRPSDLATDVASTYDVIMHALKFYTAQHNIDQVVLLQPTSPFRQVVHVREAMAMCNENVDAVYSVKETHANPYSLLFIENNEGYLEKVIKGAEYTRRQDFPKVYELNGAIYIYNAASLQKQKPGDFQKIKRYLMPEVNSVDIDTALDWAWAEFLLKNNHIRLDHG